MNRRDQARGSFVKGMAISCLLFLVVAIAAGRGLIHRRNDVARELSRMFSATARAAMPAVVSIRVAKVAEAGSMAKADSSPSRNDPYGLFSDDLLKKLFGEEVPERESPHKHIEKSQGSGFLISADGYILTNDHIVGDVDRITVELKDGRTFTNARLIGTDPESEVALIKIEGEGFPVLPMGDSGKVGIGDWVIAIGNPFGLSATVTVGVISAVGRSNINIAAYEDFIQTDAAINPGNSGGPLLNLDGEVIGINTAIISQAGGYTGIGFAIPTNMARGIAEQLKREGKVSRGYLGVLGQEVNADMVGLLGLTKAVGLLVSDVKKDSPAEKAGLSVHDVILDMNGKKVESYDAFKNDIAMIRPGSDMSITVWRDGELRELSATVGERPTTAAQGPQPAPKPQQPLELQVQALTSELAEQFGYQLGEGVIVSSVSPGSGVAEAGIHAGDLVAAIDGRYITSVDEFVAAIRQTQEGGRALFLIKRGRVSSFVVVQLR